MASKDIIPIRQFGRDGFMPDEEPWNIPLGQFGSETRNVRYDNGTLVAMGDVLSVVGPFLDDATSTTTIVPVYSAPFWYADAQILIFDNGEARAYTAPDTYDLVKAAAGLNVSAPFSHTEVGETFVLTSTAQDMQELPHTLGAASMIDMNGWPATHRAGLVTNYKSALVTAELYVSGTLRPQLVKWSHPHADADTTFYWDPTDLTRLAGESTVQTSGQGIRALQAYRDSVMIYADRETWSMDGISPPSFVRRLTDDGILGRYGHENVANDAFVVGNRDIYLHNGQTKRSLSDGKLTRWFYQNVQIDIPPKVTYYSDRNEVWVLFSITTSGKYDFALVYNTLLQAWTPIDLRVNGAAQVIDMIEGPQLVDATTYQDLIDDGVTYDDLMTTSYQDLIGVRATRMYLVTDAPGELLMLDRGADTRYRVATLIENSRMDLDEVMKTSADYVKVISRLFPQARGDLQVRFGSSTLPNGSVTWGGWVDCSEADLAADFRVAGRYVAMQIRPKPDTLPLIELSGFDLEVGVMGRR